MDRRVKPDREEIFSGPEDLSIVAPSIVDDVPNIPEPEVTARRRPTGPKPGKETPGGWRR